MIGQLLPNKNKTLQHVYSTTESGGTESGLQLNMALIELRIRNVSVEASLSWDRGLGGGGGPDNICAGRGLRRAKSTPSSDSAMSTVRLVSFN